MKRTTARGLTAYDRRFVTAVRDGRPYILPRGMDVASKVAQEHVLCLLKRLERLGIFIVQFLDETNIGGVALTPHGWEIARSLPGGAVGGAKAPVRMPEHPDTARMPRPEFESNAAARMGVTIETFRTTHCIRPCRRCDVPTTCAGWRVARNDEPAALRALCEARSFGNAIETPEPEQLAAYESVNVSMESRSLA